MSDRQALLDALNQGAKERAAALAKKNAEIGAAMTAVPQAKASKPSTSTTASAPAPGPFKPKASDIFRDAQLKREEAAGLDKPMCGGGKVKGYAKGGSVAASRRGDGCAQRGKTRGKFV